MIEGQRQRLLRALSSPLFGRIAGLGRTTGSPGPARNSNLVNVALSRILRALDLGVRDPFTTCSTPAVMMTSTATNDNDIVEGHFSIVNRHIRRLLHDA